MLLVAAQCIGCASAPVAPPPTPPAPLTAPAGNATVVVQPPAPQPCCPHPTIWEVLGFKALCQGVGGLLTRLRNRLGMVFPGLEAKPAILAITDPANLQSDNPAIKAAAEVKGDEDASQQKIKALRYLATIGCGGCYPDVQDALLAALDDCTEEVRYEAVKGLRDTAGKPCAKCKTIACCSEKVRQRLQQVAKDKDPTTKCYKESSARVRRLARLTLKGCGAPPPATASEAAPTPAPLEGPTDGTVRIEEEEDDESNDELLAELEARDPAAAKKLLPASHQPPVKASGATPSQTRSLIVPPAQAAPCNCDRTQAPTTSPNQFAASRSPAHPAMQKAYATADALPRNQGVERASANMPLGGANFKPAVEVSGKMLAKVNGEPIYESEVLAPVSRQLARLAEGGDEQVKRQVRQSLIERELKRAVDRRLVCQEARREAPEWDNRQAAFNDVAADVRDDELAARWLGRRAIVDERISPEELNAYYLGHQSKYQLPDQVRGERLSATFKKFSSRAEALVVIEHLRRRAQGVDAAPPKANLSAVELERIDWRHREELPLGPVADAMMSQPIGALSSILEDSSGFHIVRVLERHKGGPAPLEAVAGQVRQDILAARRERVEQAYVEQLRERSQVWMAETATQTPRGKLLSVRPLREDEMRR